MAQDKVGHAAMFELAAQDITQVLINERPLAMDKRYHECSAWEKGACDEWNTTVLAFAGMLFPVAWAGMTKRQLWIEALVSDDKMRAFEIVAKLESNDDLPF
jgi:hypothetical protein